MAMKLRTKVDLVILAVVMAAAALAVPNAQALGDWWHFLRYNPPAEIVALVNDSGMNDKGKRLFYRFSPELVTGDEMKERCLYLRLGCVEGTSIYILEGEEPGQKQHNQAVVTAAHEMLHVAYERLSQDEKAELHAMIDAEFKRNHHKTTERRLKEYAPEEYYNESHSLLGSEVESLQAPLEKYYAQYFSDRSKITRAYDASPEARQH